MAIVGNSARRWAIVLIAIVALMSVHAASANLFGSFSLSRSSRHHDEQQRAAEHEATRGDETLATRSALRETRSEGSMTCQAGESDDVCYDDTKKCYEPSCPSEGGECHYELKHCPYTGNRCKWNERCKEMNGMCTADDTPHCSPDGCIHSSAYWRRNCDLAYGNGGHESQIEDDEGDEYDSEHRMCDHCSTCPWPYPQDTQMCGMSWFDIVQSNSQHHWYKLAREYIAYKLNRASGSASHDQMEQNATYAGHLLDINCYVTGDLYGYHDVYHHLYSYNNGGEHYYTYCGGGSETMCMHDSDCSNMHSEDPCVVGYRCNMYEGMCEPIHDDCEDHNACTECQCVEGVGCQCEQTDCDDQDPCTEDVCDPYSGGCRHEPVDCDDQDPCTVCQCVEGVGCRCEPVDCDDGLFCTNDFCVDHNGFPKCIHQPRLCEPDDNPCHVAHRCDEQSDMCVWDEYPCDDHDPCTMDMCAVKNGLPFCVFQPLPDCGNTTHPPSYYENCTHEVKIEVDDCSALEVRELPHHVYEFCHTSTYLGEQSAVVLGFDPYDDCHLYARGTCDNRQSHPYAPNDYCSLFGEPQPQPANGWEVSLHPGDRSTNITYCANFTLSDLLECEPYQQPDGKLFWTLEDAESHTIQYKGALFATTLLPKDCDVYGECGESKVFETFFNVTVWLHANGTTSVTFLATNVHFEAEWVKNVWLTGDDAGNLKVVLRTKVKHFDSSEHYPHTSMLKNPRVHAEEETGYPIEFVDPQNPPPCVNHDGYCVQEWCLRTYDAQDVVDFSGHKPLKFDLYVHGDYKTEVSIRLDLHVKHVGAQTHLDGKIDAGLTLYHDDQFQYEYDCEDYRRPSFYDCDVVYGVLRLLYQEHLRLRIYKAYICYSADSDLLPYDPADPLNTGCNTYGTDVAHIEIYDAADPYLEQHNDYQAHHFQILHDPPYGSHQVGFSFVVHAYTEYKQVLQIHWYAEEEGGEGGLIERITEYSFGGADEDEEQPQPVGSQWSRYQRGNPAVAEQQEGAWERRSLSEFVPRSSVGPSLRRQQQQQQQQAAPKQSQGAALPLASSFREDAGAAMAEGEYSPSERFHDTRSAPPHDSDYYEDDDDGYGRPRPSYHPPPQPQPPAPYHPPSKPPAKHYQKQDHSYDHAHFSVHCPYGQHFDFTYVRCVGYSDYDTLFWVAAAVVVLVLVVASLYTFKCFGYTEYYSCFLSACCCCRGRRKRGYGYAGKKKALAKQKTKQTTATFHTVNVHGNNNQVVSRASAKSKAELEAEFSDDAPLMDI